MDALDRDNVDGRVSVARGTDPRAERQVSKSLEESMPRLGTIAGCVNIGNGCFHPAIQDDGAAWSDLEARRFGNV
jgi:hypothetical protein